MQKKTLCEPAKNFKLILYAQLISYKNAKMLAKIGFRKLLIEIIYAD